ncbi:hypothetical protein SAMN06295970_101265 [Noviherbaspirillum suwonense]|uniref:Transposase n=1 Tax=Noviherbaspirillum suwonense TaxID=1224511 RepID=A0ABY1PR57_9BURK|nr:hypothetical protein SAMN06295970_101265 [Noviherbaspirillum suwonense]
MSLAKCKCALLSHRKMRYVASGKDQSNSQAEA